MSCTILYHFVDCSQLSDLFGADGLELVSGSRHLRRLLFVLMRVTKSLICGFITRGICSCLLVTLVALKSKRHFQDIHLVYKLRFLLI